MIVQLTAEQRDVLVQLVDEALDEIGPEIHHTFTRSYRDGLKVQRRELLSLRNLLTDVPAPDALAAEAAGPV
jgi:hypothetical protein